MVGARYGTTSSPLDRPVKRVVMVESVIYVGIVIRENYIICSFRVGGGWLEQWRIVQEGCG